MAGSPKNKYWIIFRIRKALKNKRNPTRAIRRVPWAFLTLSAFPKEVRYLKEPTTNIIKRVRTIKEEDMNKIFPKTISRHFKVGTPSITHSPQGSIPAALTTNEVKNKLITF